MSEIQSFHCPSCGASLNIPENTSTITCSYCNNTVILPESLRQIAAATGPAININSVDLGDIYLMLANNQKINAVKRVRELTGLGLKESLDLVEALERGDNPTLPAVTFSTQAFNTLNRAKGRSGCFKFLALLIVSILPITFVLTVYAP
jgi:DNA-directed RNA polymerase subunit RPC12/RpoP